MSSGGALICLAGDFTSYISLFGLALDPDDSGEEEDTFVVLWNVLWLAQGLIF